MLRPIKTRVECESREKIKGLDSLAVEWILTPLSEMKRAPSQLSLDRARWNKEAIAQYERKKKAFESKAPGQANGGTKFIRVHFTSGVYSAFLFLDPAAEAFDLQTELRKYLGDLLNDVPEGAGDQPNAIGVDVSRWDPKLQARLVESLSFLCETADWKPEEFGKRKSGASSTIAGQVLRFACEGTIGKMKAAATLGLRLGQANNMVRTLADLPANELDPAAYRSRIEEFSRDFGLEFEFLDIRELESRGAGAFLAVTRADPDSKGGIACIRYRGPKGSKPKKGRKRLALVGKGICFDTGGYNVKTGDGMLGMHGDMTGSALALAICGMLAQQQPDLEITAYLAIAENLISPTAYKPNEVVIASDGTSIEVVDTDAEGRMILADTLAIARTWKPDLLIDFATLTYAAIRSLDTRRAAVFSTNRELAKLAMSCGDDSGERVWTFPLSKDYLKELESKIADILQCAPGTCADHIYAATFLSRFVGDETPWVHMDLAPARNKGGLGLISTDTTGFGVRWAHEFIQRMLKP